MMQLDWFHQIEDLAKFWPFFDIISRTLHIDIDIWVDR